jgi:hypothetical protein
MTRLLTGSVLLAAAIAVSGCERTETVTIGLDPDPFTIVTAEASGQSGVIEVDPVKLGGADYADNRGKLESASLTKLELEIIALNPGNLATELTAGTLSMRDATTGEYHYYQLDPAKLPLAIEAGAVYDLGDITPRTTGFLPALPFIDASPKPIDVFITELLKAGHTFQVVAYGATDATVNVTCVVRFTIDMKVTVKFP